MGAKGVIVTKTETGIPDCHIIQFSERKDLELRVTLRKPKYRQIHRSLHTPDLAEAMTRFGVVYADVIKEPDLFSHKVEVFITKLADEFMNEQTSRVIREEIAEGTRKGKDRSIYKGMLPYLVSRKVTKVSEVNGQTFRDYGTWRKDNFGFEQETINTEIRHIKEFLYWCQKVKQNWKGEIWLIPPLRKVKGGVKPNSAYTDEMVIEMMDYLEWKSNDDNVSPYQRLRWKIFTLYFSLQMQCGCRTSEFTYVQWKHVRVSGYNPLFPNQLEGIVNDVHIPVSKTGPRDILFESASLVLMKAIYESKGWKLNPEDYVFANILNRQRQTSQSFNKLFNQMKDDLGYGDEFTLYSTRSVYISDRIVQGSPLSLIAQQCGNSTRVIEERYQDVILKINSDQLTKRNQTEQSREEFVPVI